MRIRVTWPDRAYHGEEWPPSPLRLFAALLAGHGSAALADPELQAALRHLAELGPPTITAPAAPDCAPVTSAVPNNDADLAYALFAAGKPAAAKREISRRRELRKRTRKSIDPDGAVTYAWAEHPQTAQHRPALARLARGLCALGQGIDTAWATLLPDAATEPAEGLRWAPDPSGAHPLAVPERNTPGHLAERYRKLREHIATDGSVLYVTEAPRAMQSYHCSIDPPTLRSMLFCLRTPDDQPYSALGTEAMVIAAMSRHAIQATAQSSGFDADLITDIMGHGNHERRVTPMPMPNVGHRYADGRIRRVLMTAPETLAASLWDTLMYRLVGADLAPPHADPIAILVPADTDDRLQGAYLAKSARWVSATPIVLPGWDSRRGKPRPAKALRHLLAHADIDPALLEAADFHPAPILAGAMPSNAARLPQHLDKRPRTHLDLRLRHPIAGPIALGAGVGYGYGLMCTA
jgi:CRISPR-associated protein Csb2